MNDKIHIVSTKPLFLASQQAASYLAISESLLAKLVQTGDAPKPRKLSNGRAAYLVEDLDTWGRSRPVSDLLPPENSGHGRAGKVASASK